MPDYYTGEVRTYSFSCAPRSAISLGTHNIALGPVLTMGADVQYMEAVFLRFVENE